MRQGKRISLWLMLAGLWLATALFGTAEVQAAKTLAAPSVTVSNVRGGVKLKWKPVPGASGYNIYYKQANNRLHRISVARGRANTAYLDSRAVSGKTYTYVVRAYAGRLSSSYEEKSILCLRTITAKAKNSTSGVSLSWDSAAGAHGYCIYRKPKGGGYKKIATVLADARTYTDKTAVSGQTYLYAVKAYYGAVQGDFVPAEIQYLAAPSVKLSRISGGVQVSWNRIPGAKRYQVYRKQGSQSYAKIKDLTGETTVSWKDPTANPTKSYTYTVVASSGSVRSAYTGKTLQGDQVIRWNSSWRYAGNSKIHSSSAKLYRSPKSKGIVVAVNAGHGTIGGDSVKTLCHPDGSRKVTGGSTEAGAIYAPANSSGTVLLDGTEEGDATLSLSMILKEKLLEAGYDVLMLRENSDAQLDNIARTVLANQYADCHISIHYDDTASDKGFFFIGVPENRTYRNMTPVAQNWQKHMKLGNAILAGARQKGRKIFGSGNMPIDLTQTSYSTIPSVDVEVGDRASDHSRAAQTQIAEAIRDGIKIYFGKVRGSDG